MSAITHNNSQPNQINKQIRSLKIIERISIALTITSIVVLILGTVVLFSHHLPQSLSFLADPYLAPTALLVSAIVFNCSIFLSSIAYSKRLDKEALRAQE